MKSQSKKFFTTFVVAALLFFFNFLHLASKKLDKSQFSISAIEEKLTKSIQNAKVQQPLTEAQKLVAEPNKAEEIETLQKEKLETEEEKLSRVGLRFEERRDILKKRCEYLKIQPDRHIYGRMLYSPKYNAFGCIVAKNGASSLRVQFALMNNDPNPWGSIYTKKWMAKTLVGFDGSEKRFMMPNSTTMFVIRHPFERLVACYRNKFRNGTLESGKSTWFYRAEKTLQVDLKRDDGSKHITFEQFLIFASKFSSGDRHMKPVYQTCGICSNVFDYICELKTLTEDFDFIFREIGVTETQGDMRAWDEKPKDVPYMGYYRNVNPEVLQLVYDFTKPDMILFDYDLPDFIKSKISIVEFNN